MELDPLLRPAVLLTVLGTVWMLLAWNVHRPFRPTVTIGTVAFFAAWLTGELAVHHALVELGVLAYSVHEGALDEPLGYVGMTLTIVSSALLLRYHERGHRAGLASVRALGDAGIDPTPHQDRVPTRSVLRPFHMRDREVIVKRNVETVRFGDHTLRADIFHRADLPANAPVVVYIHGGGWVIGFRKYQGLPILNALAKRGFVCISISYRLSPSATFPEHAHDVLRGIAWAKENAARFGGDPNFVAVVGNSAGAHLSAIAALGHSEPRLRPDDLRDRDLGIDACVSIYGVYDVKNRHGHWPSLGITPFFERVVIKKRRDEDEDIFRLASPVDLVRPDAPAFFVIHGDRDSLVPVEESRRFVDALRTSSEAPVLYAEVEGAQHAFDIFHSIRGRYAVRAIVAFLESRAAARNDVADDARLREAS